MKVTYEELARDQVKILNAHCKASDMKCEFELVIVRPNIPIELFRSEEEFKYLVANNKPTSTKNYKEIRLYLHDEIENKRHIIYRNQYVANNPAVFLKGLYKETLYKEYIYSALQLQCLGLKEHVENLEQMKAMEPEKVNLTNPLKAEV